MPLLLLGAGPALAAARPSSRPDDGDQAASLAVLSPQEWKQVDQAVARALEWLARQQLSNGAFRTHEEGKLGVTGLCVLAYLAGGHVPGNGPYQKTLDAGVDYILPQQRPDGLFTNGPIPPVCEIHGRAHTAMYSHAICGLTLSEVHGMTGGARAAAVRSAVEKAITFTRQCQREPKRLPKDLGGWRYLRPYGPVDSDLSVTSWQIMFLRSARNAGFDVPAEPIDEAVRYVRRCFDYDQHKTFLYGLTGRACRPTRAMTGAGIFTLSLGGVHDVPEARAAADTLFAYPFDRYNQPAAWPRPELQSHLVDRYHYGAFYCTQAMFQLGGRYWMRFFPPLVRTLLANQSPDGSWAPEAVSDDLYGNAYTTALVVLTLSTPKQLLPIFQR